MMGPGMFAGLWRSVLFALMIVFTLGAVLGFFISGC